MEPLAPNPSSTPPAPAPVPPAAEANPYEPMVHGESAYDRVSSMLMSVVIGAALIVGWLWLVYATQTAYAQPPVAKLEIVEVYGGGGSPEGTAGAGESIDVPGAIAGASASNSETEDASNFEEPSMMESTSSALDPFAAQPEDGFGGGEVGSDSPRGGALAGGTRSSKIGTGGLGLGPGGPGDGGVPRELRWELKFPPGQTADDYAQMLDSFGVELGTFEGSNTFVYASQFAGATPLKRIGLSAQDKRWYVNWQGGGARKQYDTELMKKAGIEVGSKPILHFYPPKIEDRLARLEVAFKGRQPAEISRTSFQIVPQGRGFDFAVLSQNTLR